MTIEQAKVLRPGDRVIYNDGRKGHQDVAATVLAIDRGVMVVQFDDRADTTRIGFIDRAWLDYLTILEQ